MHRRIAGICAEAGLDLCTVLQVGWYNDEVGDELRLPDFGNRRSLAMVVGNTRALWQPLLERARSESALREDPDPVERYVTDVVRGAADAVACRSEIRWSHTLGDGMVAIQRLAQVAGLAYLSPSRLSVHPFYGPWIGLRAAVVVDVDGPDERPRGVSPCTSCDEPCVAILRKLVARSPDEVSQLEWVSVRDACPVGRAQRYGPEQIAYHYEKDRAVFRSAVARSTESVDA